MRQHRRGRSAVARKIAENTGDAGSDDVVGGEPLVLVGGGHQGGAGGPERVEDDDQEKDAEQRAAGRDVAAGPVGEKPWAEGHHDEDDDDGDEKGELAGAAVQGAGECDSCLLRRRSDISGSKVLLTIWTICRATRETVRAVLKTTTCGGAEGVADGEQASLQVEGVAEGKAHEGDGGAGELADLGEAGVAASRIRSRGCRGGPGSRR